MNIYVGNLGYDVTESDLREAFAESGEVTTVSIISDRQSGDSKGFGFVEMPDKNDAQTAIKNLHDKPLKGRNMRVNEAKPRPQRHSTF